MYSLKSRGDLYQIIKLCFVHEPSNPVLNLLALDDDKLVNSGECRTRKCRPKNFLTTNDLFEKAEECSVI